MRSTNSSTSKQVIKQVADTSWEETTMNYNNKPSLGTVIASFTGGSSGTWKEVDISSAVGLSIGQIYSLGIDSIGNDGYGFASRESNNKPILLITTQ